MSSITLIGTGNMARAIGSLAVAGGNTVEVMGRDPSKADDLATALGGGTTTGTWGAVPTGRIVITAVLYDGGVPVVTEFGDALADKIIIDISNPFNSTFDGLAHNEQTSIAQEVAMVAPASASVFIPVPPTGSSPVGGTTACQAQGAGSARRPTVGTTGTAVTAGLRASDEGPALADFTEPIPAGSACLRSGP